MRLSRGYSDMLKNKPFLVPGMLFICRIKPLIFGDAETTIRSRSRDEYACRPRD
jgi:hypothetical protein